MEKKFELTSEVKQRYSDGAVLHRIRALRKIKCQHRVVKPGELGGWLEKESNRQQYELAVQLAIATLGGGEETNDAEKSD